MKKIYEQPRGEIIEIQFHSPLMVSENNKEDVTDPTDPFAPKRRVF